VAIFILKFFFYFMEKKILYYIILPLFRVNHEKNLSTQ
jgi:hypothetical protein